MAVQLRPTITIPEKFEKFSRYVSEEAMSTPSTPSTPCSPPAESYEIRMITQDDKELVLDHLRRFFFRDEPLNVDIKLLEHEDSRCIDLEEYSVKCIDEGNSLLAITESGKIVGISLNGVCSREDPEEDDECEDPKFSKILKLLHTVDKKADVFTKFPDVDMFIIVKILSVDGEWRGKGIAKELMDRTRDLARQQGLKLMRVDCSSHYSARAIARLGFECVYTLKYADYKENGIPVFSPAHPHNEVKVYTQRI